MQLGGLRQVVSPQWCGEEFGHHAGARMHHHQPMCRRESAAWALPARLPEVFLQFRRIGHRETRTIHKEDAMPQPTAGGECLLVKLFDRPLQQQL